MFKDDSSVADTTDIISKLSSLTQLEWFALKAGEEQNYHGVVSDRFARHFIHQIKDFKNLKFLSIIFKPSLI